MTVLLHPPTNRAVCSLSVLRKSQRCDIILSKAQTRASFWGPSISLPLISVPKLRKHFYSPIVHGETRETH